MSKESFVIVKEVLTRPGGQFFLTDSGGWSQEYPDARIFTSYQKADRYSDKVDFNPNEALHVVRDYGLESEEWN